MVNFGNKHVDSLIKRYPQLDPVLEQIVDAYNVIKEAYKRDKKLLIAGNGGSAADSEHIAGELMKSFSIPRPIDEELAKELERIDPVRGGDLANHLEKGLTAIPLVAHEALSTAFINDVDGYGVFAQQLLGFGRSGDVFLAISTSGNSKNIINAAILAKALKISIIGLTGMDGGELGKLSDVTIRVPETETFKVQELHMPVYHCLCLMLEEEFFGGEMV